ncbi:sensor histidine kinase [Aestuariimicrobium sp. Y1814]|uniref:sensor histidine kinase n=1 Tax=Aestuariimicrobium sp. Y1814 TaxID=3418742 RepID=UPI003DA74463
MSFPARPHPGTEESAFRLNAALVGVASLVLGVPHLAMLNLGLEGLIAYLTGQAMMFGLLWRRRNPRLMLLIVTVAGIVQMLLVSWPTGFLIAIPIAVYSYARWVEGRPRMVLVIGFAAAVLGPLTWFPNLIRSLTGQGEAFSGELTAFILFVLVCAGLVVTPYAFGRRVRDAAMVKEQRIRAQQEHYQSVMRGREHAARMAEVNTRNQIARELHDIVAHSVSVMIVQAEGGRALAAKKPEAAAEVLTTIAETGRDALTEMRRLVGVLRAGPDEQADYNPTPGVEDLPNMVERAGDRVSLEVTGQPRALSPAMELTIFRVAQEGVTNFLKHAGPEAHCVVRLHHGPHHVQVEVADDGLGAAATSDGEGHGLQGMHERVSAMGGRLSARPGEQGGFVVRAVFPTGSGDHHPGGRPATAQRPRPGGAAEVHPGFPSPGSPPSPGPQTSPTPPTELPAQPPYRRDAPIPIPGDPRKLEER